MKTDLFIHLQALKVRRRALGGGEKEEKGEWPGGAGEKTQSNDRTVKKDMPGRGGRHSPNSTATHCREHADAKKLLEVRLKKPLQCVEKQAHKMNANPNACEHLSVFFLIQPLHLIFGYIFFLISIQDTLQMNLFFTGSPIRRRLFPLFDGKSLRQDV